MAGFVSYRDPNLARTKEVFEGIPAFIRSFDGDENLMTKYIIGTLSDMDAPLTPSQEGARSFHAYRAHLTEEILQRERDEVLNAGKEDIRRLAEYIDKLLECKAICVVGTESEIEKNRNLFGSVENLI